MDTVYSRRGFADELWSEALGSGVGRRYGPRSPSSGHSHKYSREKEGGSLLDDFLWRERNTYLLSLDSVLMTADLKNLGSQSNMLNQCLFWLLIGPRVTPRQGASPESPTQPRCNSQDLHPWSSVHNAITTVLSPASVNWLCVVGRGDVPWPINASL